VVASLAGGVSQQATGVSGGAAACDSPESVSLSPLPSLPLSASPPGTQLLQSLEHIIGVIMLQLPAQTRHRGWLSTDVCDVLAKLVIPEATDSVQYLHHTGAHKPCTLGQVLPDLDP